MSKWFDLVDVFHDGPFSGNPLAVAAAENIGTATMLRMTRWFNLSEIALPSAAAGQPRGLQGAHLHAGARVMPCILQVNVGDNPGAILCANICGFSSVLHRRRHSTPGMTSTNTSRMLQSTLSTTVSSPLKTAVHIKRPDRFLEATPEKQPCPSRP